MRVIGWAGILVIFLSLDALDRGFTIKSQEWYLVSLAGQALCVLGYGALLLALRRGFCPPWLPVVALVGDAVSYGVMLLVWRHAYGIETYRHPGVVITQMLVCASISLNGVLRFKKLTARLGSALTIVLIAEIVWLAGLSLWYALIVSIFVATFARRASWLADIAQTAIRSEVAQTTLSRFLPAAVMERAHSDPAKLAEARTCVATVMMTDVRGFSAWAEKRAPEEVLTFVSRVQGELAAAVVAHGGYVDKFLGDGMLAVFGVLEKPDGHAARAIACAEDIQRRVGALDVKVGIGVHTGAVVAGCIGAGERLEFTVLGDTVNTAARLQAHTKEAGVAVLISGDCAESAGNQALDASGETVLRGREKATKLFTLRVASLAKVG